MEVRQFFAGFVNKTVLEVFQRGGLPEHQWELAAREHGKLVKDWFWEAKRLRDAAVKKCG